RLAHEVELIEDRLLVLTHDLDRPQPMGVGPIAVRQVGERVEHFQVAFDERANARSDNFDDDFLAVLQLCGMHLRDRRRGERSFLESRETSSIGASYAAATIARASVPGNGGTRSCNFSSSSAMSRGRRSRRVESIWPNFMKIGPSSSSASRNLSPREPARSRWIQVAGER